MAGYTNQAARLVGVHSSTIVAPDDDHQELIPGQTFSPARLVGVQYDWKRPGEPGRFQSMVEDFADFVRHSPTVDRDLLDSFCKLVKNDEEAWQLAETMIPEFHADKQLQPEYNIHFIYILSKLKRLSGPVLPRMVYRSEQEFLDCRHARMVESLSSGWGMIPARAKTEIEERIATLKDLAHLSKTRQEKEIDAMRQVALSPFKRQPRRKAAAPPTENRLKRKLTESEDKNEDNDVPSKKDDHCNEGTPAKRQKKYNTGHTWHRAHYTGRP
ncbi:MAG: hypothetical protein Q9200_003423 [Gallowayella weberi]